MNPKQLSRARSAQKLSMSMIAQMILFVKSATSVILNVMYVTGLSKHGQCLWKSATKVYSTGHYRQKSSGIVQEKFLRRRLLENQGQATQKPKKKHDGLKPRARITALATCSEECR